nr:alpha-(1,3)-fucosyltransferase C-like [Maniola hyperantus]
MDSDIFSPFFEVKDLEGNVVAPKPVVNWNSNMTLLDESDIEKLKDKKKAMAWIVTKCKTRNDRMLTAKRLQRLFRENALDFDIFGCGFQECPQEGCLKALERDYYFYYAPEDSHAKDYVTSEVLVGYDHYAVPIVNGGADYRK